MAEEDHSTRVFLQWFVAEQVEEESNADSLVQKLKLIEGFPAGLFMIDNELAGRTFTPEAAG
jgi:ferritin